MSKTFRKRPIVARAAVFGRFAALVALVGLPAVARAEDDSDAADPPAAAPAGADATADKAPALSTADKADPLLSSVLESNPQTAPELTRAIKILIDAGRPALAKRYVQRLIALKLPPRELDQLLEQFGSNQFVEISSVPELAALAGPFVEKMLADADTFRRNPARLNKMIAALRSPDRYARRTAVQELQRAHEAAAVALVGVLADPRRPDDHGAVFAALAQMGSDAVGPVRAALDANDPALKTQMMTLAARLGDKQATNLLVRSAVDPQADAEQAQAARDAIGMLTGAAINLADGRRVLEREIGVLLASALRTNDADAIDVEVWRWDAEKSIPHLVTVSPAVAAADRAARLAIDLAALDAVDPAAHAAARRLSLIARLTAAKLDQDLDQPLPTGDGTPHDAAVAAGADALDAALAAAMAENNPLAATAAAQILGEIGTAELLTRHGARLAPLASALQSANRRVRFAALATIVKIAPATRFPGDGFVRSNLAYFAGTSGARRVLIGHPRLDMAQLLAGLLAANGYETDVATTGREAFRLAITSPDYDCILLHYALRDSQLDDLLTSLRRDPFTRQLPIGILALARDRASVVETTTDKNARFVCNVGAIVEAGGAEDKAEAVKSADGRLLRLGFVPDVKASRMAQSVPPALAFIEPGAAPQMKIRINELMQLIGRRNVPFAERQRQAALAVGWIGELAEKSKKIHELRSLSPLLVAALSVPSLESAATDSLVSIGGVQCEQALLDVANSNLQPLAARQGAAEAFRRCVQRHGILLTSAELTRQYNVYNASASAPPEVQALLALVLDTLEKRADDADPAPTAPAKSK